MKQNNWQNRLTILVNSCDSYEDLWNPFFTLLQRYWFPLDCEIVLNTETKEYTFPGLNLRVSHCNSTDYGNRMLQALSGVQTKYVLLLLDDFFVREPVRQDRLEQILQWMDGDWRIAYFNTDVTRADYDWEVDRYPGYRRLPRGNRYTLNMQAAVWRTDRLKDYWRKGVSPWDWEERCNVRTANDFFNKFYCALTPQDSFIEYGHVPGGWGVYHGKWYEEDVVPLFQKEKIPVDFSVRGFLREQDKKPYLQYNAGRGDRYRLVYNCLGWWYLLPYFIFCRRCNIYSALHHCAVDEDYFHYLQRKADLRNKEGKRCLFAPMVR